MKKETIFQIIFIIIMFIIISLLIFSNQSSKFHTYYNITTGGECIELCWDRALDRCKGDKLPSYSSVHTEDNGRCGCWCEYGNS